MNNIPNPLTDQGMKENFYLDAVVRMHDHFGMTKVTDNLDQDKFDELMKLRVSMIQEEVNELSEALENRDPEEVVDALIDILVFTFGTVDIIIDGRSFLNCYSEVMEANMKKKVGIKEGRPNPFGLPDLMKPEGWNPPELDKYLKHVDKRLS